MICPALTTPEPHPYIELRKGVYRCPCCHKWRVQSEGNTIQFPTSLTTAFRLDLDLIPTVSRDRLLLFRSRK